MKTTLTLAILASALNTHALDYPHVTAEPQKTGWPLSAEERAYVLKSEFERRPGSEVHKHLPPMWPVVPSAGSWGGTSWLDTHERLVEYVKANAGPIDVLLVGDSITQQWGSPLDKGVLNDAWKKHFSGCKTINIGIGGDKAQNVLWRLDHGGVEGLQPKVVVVMIGNNNMFFAPETGVEAAAKGAQMVVANVREKFPQAEIIAARILPCHAPGNAFYENIKKTNAALDALNLGSDPKVQVLDLWSDFANADGTIKKPLFGPDNIHLSLEGYGVYAERLKPLLDKFLGAKGLGGDVIIPAKNNSETPTSPSPRSAKITAPVTLKPGDTAPKLSVGAWLKGDPISELARDKAYLVDFWATWCSPCVAIIPHLNELHLKFKDKGLIVVGQAVSKDDQAKVISFCEKMGAKMSYRVALDDFSTSDRGSMAESWGDAAGLRTLPSAILVGKDGRIAWIGDPRELKEKTIEEVLARTFDVAKATADSKKQSAPPAKQKMNALMQALTEKNWDEADKVLTEFSKIPDGLQPGMLPVFRSVILLGKSDFDALDALLEREKLSPEALSAMAGLLTDANNGNGDNNPRIQSALARVALKRVQQHKP